MRHTMNIFVQELAHESIDGEPETGSARIAIEDNVGESIHIHYRNARLEMSISDFVTFAEEVSEAKEVLVNGNC